MAMPRTITGGCLCSAVRYEAGLPQDAAWCHCSMCRRATGAPAGLYVSVDTAGFRFTDGRPERYRSSQIAERSFCRHCDSPLAYRRPGTDRIALAIGSLDAPEAVAPERHVGTESALPWLRIEDGLPRQETRDPVKRG